MSSDPTDLTSRREVKALYLTSSDNQYRRFTQSVRNHLQGLHVATTGTVHGLKREREQISQTSRNGVTA